MSTIDPISKDNPIHLYRIILKANKSYGKGTYKEFSVFYAWSSKDFDVCGSDKRLVDFYYKDRLYRKQAISLDEGVPYISKSVFNIWFYERNDTAAIKACKEWLKSRIDSRADEVRNQAWRIVHDREFMNDLTIAEN